MESNEIIREQIFEVIENQMKSNDPPETKITYERLIDSGYSKMDAKKLIGQCVAVEIYNVIRDQKPFDEKRYIKNLKQLPKEPTE